MESDYAELIESGSVYIYADPGVAGVIVLRTGPQCLEIENVAVDPRRQGAGIGRALLEFAEAAARADGASGLCLYTNSAMHENLAIYTHLGWSEYDRRTQAGFERVFFRKPVSPQ